MEQAAAPGGYFDRRVVVSEVKTQLISGIVLTLSQVSFQSRDVTKTVAAFVASVNFYKLVIPMWAELIWGEMPPIEFPTLKDVVTPITTNLLMGWIYWMLIYDPRRRGGDVNNSGYWLESIARIYLDELYHYLGSAGLFILYTWAVSICLVDYMMVFVILG